MYHSQMKNRILPTASILFGLLAAILPVLISKGKYPLLSLSSILIGLLFLSGGVLLYLKHRLAVFFCRIAAFASIMVGGVLSILLVWSGTYVKSIFGALGAVISGTLFMSLLAVANLFFLFPGILLYALRNRMTQGKSLSS